MKTRVTSGMESPVDHGAMPACGYAVPWSVRAGSCVTLHASTADADATVGLRRLDRPAVGVDWQLSAGPAPLGPRSLVRGSWLDIEGLGAPSGAVLALELLVTRNATSRALLSWGDLALTVDPRGTLALSCGALRAEHGGRLSPWRWTEVRLAFTADRVELTACPAGARGDLPRLHVACETAALAAAPLRLGRGASGPAANWRLARLSMSGSRDVAWRFPARGPVAAVAAVGPGPVLRVHNDPTFACASPRWDGSVDDPRLAPDHYDAIHLHEDDIGPLDWPATHAAAVPKDAPSGIYAFAVSTRAGTEAIPFFVRPDRPRAPVAFLAPTLTYAAYADEALPPERFAWLCDDRGHRFARANGLLSLYDEHVDGSGVSLKSIDHPKATLRPDYRYPLSGSPHLLPVDLQLLAFCHEAGIAFDVLTDGDLHAEGAEALRPYAGVFTGSHPEYWTGPMQTALARWLDEGGNLACLGGNGFMWVTALADGRVEVRRGGTLASRTWDGRPGEITMAIDGTRGGLWRERGWPEFAVTGTGMTMMGFGPALPYRRLPASHDPAWAWAFDGVGDEPIGPAGRVLGGAAGYEVDRVDARLGTPEGTVVLARAEGFGPAYELDGNDYLPDPMARQAARRADFAARSTDAGGLVFSTGSVSWCGALPGNGRTNAVGTITANILGRLARRVA